MARVTLRLGDDLNDRVEEHIGYGSKSEWVREAVREKLDREEDVGGEQTESTAADA